MTEILVILLSSSSFLTVVITTVVNYKKDKSTELKEKFDYWEKKFDEFGCFKKSCKERVQ